MRISCLKWDYQRRSLKLNKKTIFKYEIKRLLFSREYLLLLATVLIYAILLLRANVILGTGYTAPFSKWTFSDYISSVSTLLFILLIVLCARQFKASEQGAMSIISASPMPISLLKSIRYGALACAFLVATTLTVGICFAFYWLLFGYTLFGELILLSMIMLLPPALMIFGAAMLMGHKNVVLIYLLLAIILIMGIFRIALPIYVDIFGRSLLTLLYSGVHTFELPPVFIASRVTFIAFVIVSIFFSLKQSSKIS